MLRDTLELEAPGKVQLPTAVWAAVARLGADLDRDLERGVLAPTAAGPSRVEASPAGEAGSVAVVLAPQCPPAPADLPATWPLTGRERDVLALVARGMGNRHVAAALGVSENTVEAHLAHAYAKLGVHRRGEFLAHLFRAPGGTDRATWSPRHDRRAATGFPMGVRHRRSGGRVRHPHRPPGRLAAMRARVLLVCGLTDANWAN